MSWDWRYVFKLVLILLNKLIRNEENKDIYSLEKKDYLQDEIYTLKRKILINFGLPLSNKYFALFNDLNYWTSSSLELVDLSSNYIDSEQIQYIDKKKKLQHSKMVD